MANLVTFSFTGAVSQVSTPLFPALNAGQTLSGSFQFNDAILDSNGSGTIGRYNNAITALTVNLGPFSGFLGTATPGNNNFIRILNNPSADAYEVRAPLDSTSSVGSFDPVFFRITLKDPSGTVFINDHLPTVPPSLSSFATDRFRIVFEDGSGVARVLGSLTSLTAVPLPAAVILFGAGLVALIGLGAGTWRKRNNSLT
jgi:hypothetical protein